MKRPRNFLLDILLPVLALGAALLMAGCHSQASTAGNPQLPVFHQQPGQPSPAELADMHRANRKP
ncbi:MAG TPA: hypothetical protein VFW40_06750 [Capsulimonadaceae bacterium]|nr:hypothetical protein [Capsulimonadaceae bacterium]